METHAGTWTCRPTQTTLHGRPGIKQRTLLLPILKDFRQCDEATGGWYLTEVANVLKKYQKEKVSLKMDPSNGPSGEIILKITHEHLFSQKDEEEWGDFYLPDEVNMLVLGTVSSSQWCCPELALMTCENKNVYAYDGEDLHVVASSMKELFVKGLKYPGSERFYRGEPFKDMTEKDWDLVRESAVGKELDEEHLKLVTAAEDTFMRCLDF